MADFMRIPIILLYGAVKLTIGKQKNTGEYIQYCITVPGSRMHKKSRLGCDFSMGLVSRTT